MKKYYVYICSFFLMMGIFTLFYYVSYRSLVNRFQNQDSGLQEEVADSKKDGQKNDTAENDVSDEESVLTDAGKKTIISSETEYVLKIYNRNEDTTREESKAMPEYLVGLDREGVEDYLGDYMEGLSLEEYLDGLVSFEMESFSADRLVLRKTYDIDSVDFRFYVIEENGEVVVYYSDKKTVYQYTGIFIDGLPLEEKNKLKYGILVKDEKELFALLENFSS